VELTRNEPLVVAVVISRNEEPWIETTLQAALAAVEPFPDSEIVLVDSCSTDRTVARAQRFAVRLIELRPDAPLSPALGRLVGQHLTRSRYILFIDGDTEIDTAWVTTALEYLESHAHVAAVDGKLPERYYENGRQVGSSPDVFAAGDAPAEVEGLGGNALYRRSALEGVGSFNPFIVSYEEAELAARLRQSGTVVVRLPVVMGTHRTGVRGSLRELGRRYRENLIKGYGQVLRVALGQGTFLAHARRMKRYLQFQAVVACALLAGIASALTGDLRLVAVPLLLAALLVALFMVRSRSLTKPLKLIADWAVWTPPMIRGFLERPREPRALRPLDMIARDRDYRPAAGPLTRRA
jgi:glycosyltransferase involved in cell wall biosynthesis